MLNGSLEWPNSIWIGLVFKLSAGGCPPRQASSSLMGPAGSGQGGFSGVWFNPPPVSDAGTTRGGGTAEPSGNRFPSHVVVCVTRGKEEPQKYATSVLLAFGPCENSALGLKID